MADEFSAPASNSHFSGQKNEVLYKILVIGELGTGKTSFIKRYIHQYFSQHYRATIGVDFALKVINWDANTIIRLQMWDIAGQVCFQMWFLRNTECPNKFWMEVFFRQIEGKSILFVSKLSRIFPPFVNQTDFFAFLFKTCCDTSQNVKFHFPWPHYWTFRKTKFNTFFMSIYVIPWTLY